jgi:hypothetical protein
MFKVFNAVCVFPASVPYGILSLFQRTFGPFILGKVYSLRGSEETGPATDYPPTPPDLTSAATSPNSH